MDAAKHGVSGGGGKESGSLTASVSQSLPLTITATFLMLKYTNLLNQLSQGRI